MIEKLQTQLDEEIEFKETLNIEEVLSMDVERFCREAGLLIDTEIKDNGTEVVGFILNLWKDRLNKLDERVKQEVADELLGVKSEDRGADIIWAELGLYYLDISYGREPRINEIRAIALLFELVNRIKLEKHFFEKTNQLIFEIKLGTKEINSRLMEQLCTSISGSLNIPEQQLIDLFNVFSSKNEPLPQMDYERHKIFKKIDDLELKRQIELNLESLKDNAYFLIFELIKRGLERGLEI